MRSRRGGVAAAVITIGAGFALAGEAPSATSTSAGATSATAQEAEELARKSRCFDCHGADGQAVGPSFRAVAARYREAPGARDTLIAVVAKGGKLKWPEARGVPMPPYSERLSEEEIARLVDWVLSLD